MAMPTSCFYDPRRVRSVRLPWRFPLERNADSSTPRPLPAGLLFLVTVVALVGCGGDYREFYSGQPELQEEPATEPRLVVVTTNRQLDDFICEGYKIVGKSDFWSEREESDGGAIKQGRRVGCEVVLLKKTLSGQRDVSWVQPIYNPGTVTNSTTTGQFGNTSYQANTSTQNPGSTTYVPRNETIYRVSYLAVYLSKIDLSKLKLGVSFSDGVPENIRSQIKTNAGVYVRFCYKNSIAYKNDIMMYDVILKVNGKNVYTSKEVHDAIKDSKSINLTIWRSGQEMEKTIEF